MKTKFQKARAKLTAKMDENYDVLLVAAAAGGVIVAGAGIIMAIRAQDELATYRFENAKEGVRIMTEVFRNGFAELPIEDSVTEGVIRVTVHHAEKAIAA